MIRTPTLRSLAGLALLAPLGLAACTVAPPTGPQVLAMPPAGKNLAVFQGEDAQCRNYASASIGNADPAQAANQSAIGSAAVGTALGAAAGALIGSATGNFGAGAAIGAGTGLVGGSLVGGGNARSSAGALQQRYDTAYAQCMASLGNQLQAPVGTVGYGYPAAAPYYAPSGVSVGVGYGRGYW
ncbi:glycine zipper family protein [Siccirubricoccus sp. KC 17139]|uniref:Glycine zipper family protein n=1 Tax=Siccirubricoccus soli TaxID=2899147 RepID=A0ABT1D6H3_9PROT|nr:glycine zipper family protein [Siccirubricoccus soli]MCO6417531.1 glycine zipper family protein [Siccirubricoccus soli]MCP2683666.1 glycine zipper family protein [Siccirubricoccus soli]